MICAEFTGSSVVQTAGAAIYRAVRRGTGRVHAGSGVQASNATPHKHE